MSQGNGRGVGVREEGQAGGVPGREGGARNQKEECSSFISTLPAVSCTASLAGLVTLGRQVRSAIHRR